MRRVKFKVVSLYHNGRRFSAFARGNYSLDYRKGTTVIAGQNTFGVAVFKTRRQADIFIEVSAAASPLQRIRVRPIGRGKTVEFICSGVGERDLDDFYGRKVRNMIRKPPPGTIFYPAVEVLD